MRIITKASISNEVYYNQNLTRKDIEAEFLIIIKYKNCKNMKEQLISLDTAKLAKEKGFKYILTSWYDSKTKNLFQNELYVNEVFKKSVGPYGNKDIRDFKACLTTMDNSLDEFILAPTQSILQKWLREEHNIILTPIFSGANNFSNWYYQLFKKGDTNRIENAYWLTYEEALEEGLQKALKLIKL